MSLTSKAPGKLILFSAVASLLISTCKAEASTEGRNAGIIVGVIWFCLAIVFPCWMYYNLKKRDDTLPANQRCMTTPVTCGYWITCFFTGCLGSVVYYLIAAHEIDKLHAASTPRAVPVRTSPNKIELT